MTPKRFTRDEAEELLPYIAPLLFKLRELKRQQDDLQAQRTELVQKSRGNGHGVDNEAGKVQREMEELGTHINELIEKVQGMGIELKDPELGLVDFRSIREGREVYLCWQLGEEHLSFWHEIDAGFAGRQPLEEAE
jgi:hypothetical protein